MRRIGRLSCPGSPVWEQCSNRCISCLKIRRMKFIMWKLSSFLYLFNTIKSKNKFNHYFFRDQNRIERLNRVFLSNLEWFQCFGNNLLSATISWRLCLQKLHSKKAVFVYCLDFLFAGILSCFGYKLKTQHHALTQRHAHVPR